MLPNADADVDKEPIGKRTIQNGMLTINNTKRTIENGTNINENHDQGSNINDNNDNGINFKENIDNGINFNDKTNKSTKDVISILSGITSDEDEPQKRKLRSSSIKNNQRINKDDAKKTSKNNTSSSDSDCDAKEPKRKKSRYAFKKTSNNCTSTNDSESEYDAKESKRKRSKGNEKKKGRKPRPTDQKVKCEFCPKTFSALRWNTGHCNKDHKELIRDRWHLCEPCKVYFPTAASLMTHNGQKHRLHDSIKTYDFHCTFCPKKVKDGLELQKHCHRHHKELIDQEWHKCQICEKAFQIQATLEKHMRIVHKISSDQKKKLQVQKQLKHPKCQFCNANCNTQKKYHSHCNEHHLEEVKKIWDKCLECHNYVPTSGMAYHVKFWHPTNGFKCLFCTKAFQNKWLCYNHINYHHPKNIEEHKWLQCSKCKFSFPEESIEEHTERKHKEEIKCHWCEIKFFSTRPFLTHCRQNHYTYISTEWQKCPTCQVYYPPPSEVFSKHICDRNKRVFMHCEYCFRCFRGGALYYLHVTKAHKEEVEKYWFPCQVCFKYFPSQPLCKTHQTSKHQMAARVTFPCPFCKTNLLNKTQIIKHANENHQKEVKEKWNCCHKCEVAYPSLLSLYQHQSKSHKLKGFFTMQKQKCDFCPKMLQKNLYSTHARKNHFELVEKLWESCSICGEYFPNQRSLLCHKSLMHNSKSKKVNKQRINCKYCQKSVLSSQFVYHINRVHHNEIKEIWHGCNDCDLYFPLKKSLKLHIKNKHAERVVTADHICNFCKQEFTFKADVIKHTNEVHLKEMESKWFRCSLCKSYYPTEKSLQKHNVSKHLNKNKVKAPRLNCQFYENQSYTFVRPQAYRAHCNEEHKNKLAGLLWKQCVKCDLYFEKGISLKKHNSKVHKLRCEHCNKKFKSSDPKASRTKHMNLFHRNKIPSNWLRCNDCGWGSISNTGLYKHTRNYCPRISKETNSGSAVDDFTSSSLHQDPVMTESQRLNKNAKIILSRDAIKKWHLCRACGSTYLETSALLAVHNLLFHEEDATPESELNTEIIIKSESWELNLTESQKDISTNAKP